jgi:hypothetical protein
MFNAKHIMQTAFNGIKKKKIFKAVLTPASKQRYGRRKNITKCIADS